VVSGACPPALGYGARGSGPVPPDAALVFAIDLVDAR
jgi:FKBP-type peptidyl-prolyl cis-trans isomerase